MSATHPRDVPVIEGAGTPEAAWQAWAPLAALQIQPWEALLPAAARCVIVAPHPDDEVLIGGGLLAMHAARGGEGLVIGVTDGEGSHAGVAGWHPAALARLRRAERTAGLGRLGAQATRVVGLGLPDGRVADHAGAVVAALDRALRPHDLVLTTWRHDGHPDHDACGIAVVEAAARVGARVLEAPVWMWHWAVPGDARVPWPRLRAVPLSAAALTCRRAALMAHASQWRPRSASLGAVLTPAIADRMDRPAEYFFG